jgi:hypothetical protein
MGQKTNNKNGGICRPVRKNRGISLRFKESRHVAKKEEGRKKG